MAFKVLTTVNPRDPSPTWMDRGTFDTQEEAEQKARDLFFDNNKIKACVLDNSDGSQCFEIGDMTDSVTVTKP